MKPEFGEQSGDVRAEADVYVRRPLNEYSGLDEVFQFSFIEHARYRLDNISVRDMLWAVGIGGGLVLFPLCGLFLFVEASENDSHDYFDAAFAYAFGTMFWVLFATLVFI